MSVLQDLLNPATLWGAVAFGLIFLLMAVVLARILRTWGHRIASHSDLGIDQTALRFVIQLMQLFCFVLAAIFYAHLVPFLHQVGTAMLASAGVASLVIGLAAQNTLGQIIAGISLLLYRPYGIGDVLTLNAPTGKETGVVKEFTLGYTKLQTEDGRWIIVPNSVMMASTIIKNK
jgi:small-conductance mechanosensitive channel